MSWRRSNKWKVVIVVCCLLVAVGAAMPTTLRLYVSHTLNNLPGYSAKVGQVSIDFLSAGYQIDSIRIFRARGGKNIPFFKVDRLKVNLQWESLLYGRLVAEVRLDRPAVNFVAVQPYIVQVAGDETDWPLLLRKITFLPVNYMTIKDGTVAYLDFGNDPPLDLFLRNIDMESHNLANVKNERDHLPARIFGKAHSIGGGSLSVVMKMNAMKEHPDVDLDLKFESVDMSALKDFLSAYAHLDVLRGDFNLYAELTVTDGIIQGYVKPRLDNVTLNGSPQPIRLVVGDLAKLKAGSIAEKTNYQLITRVPLDGKIRETDNSFWPAIWNLFRNASVEGFERNTRSAGHLASGHDGL